MFYLTTPLIRAQVQSRQRRRDITPTINSTTILSHTCAVVAGGAQRWGSNNAGQLGDATTVSSSSPVTAIPVGSGVTSISAGAAHTCAVIHGGALEGVLIFVWINVFDFIGVHQHLSAVIFLLNTNNRSLRLV